MEKIIKIGGKDYTFKVTIGTLAPMERELGTSLLALFAEAKTQEGVLRLFSVERLKTILKYCLQGVKQDDQTIYDLMQQYIEDGHTIDELVSEVLNDFVVTSGFFAQKKPQKAKGNK